jgi:DNA-directed RNA polymerase III subunit RPC3
MQRKKISRRQTNAACKLVSWVKSNNISQRIFTILLRRGRLPIQSLAQHTRLTRRQLQHGLVVLIQQNLIYYLEEGPQATFYEANQGAAYGLVRSGKILEIVESRYGTRARGIMQKLFLLGHAAVGDLADSYQPHGGSPESPESPANGTSNAVVQSNPQSCTPMQLDFILCELLEAGLVEPVTEIAFRSPDDTYNEVEQATIKSDFTGGTKGTKQKEMLKTIIREKLQTLRLESKSWKPKGNKRKLDAPPANGINGNAKRRKFSNGSLTVNGNHHGDENLRLEVGSSSCQSRMIAC